MHFAVASVALSAARFDRGVHSPRDFPAGRVRVMP